jgi:hypothetical protein
LSSPIRSHVVHEVPAPHAFVLHDNETVADCIMQALARQFRWSFDVAGN